MARLIHELWEEPGGLTAVCLAGPDGDGGRRSLAQNSRLVSVFEAGSHFEAMTTYHERMGWAPYATTEAGDREPYPESWAERQRAAVS
jgi:hypothetical protein